MHISNLPVSGWGQMRPGDYDMSKMTLFTGETGAGKSTMLDAIQAVMTAAHHNVLNFNPGQDEMALGSRRGKTRRSIESYVVGAEYSKFSRPNGAQGYVGAVFVPSAGELVKPFTALMAISAVVEGNGETRQAKLESLSFFILDGVQLSYSDLMEDPVAGVSIPVEKIGAHLKRKFPNVLEFGNKKTDYLQVLYGRFRGRPGPVSKEEAMEAAKALVQSIAYRPIGHIHDLVRDEILEHDPIQLREDVERISSLMRQVSELRKESDYLNGSVKRLNTLNGSLDSVCKLHVEGAEARYLALMASACGDTQKVTDLKSKIEGAQRDIDELARAQESLSDQKATLENQRMMVEARLQGVPGQQQKKLYEERINAANLAVAKSLRELTIALRTASLIESRAKAVLADAERLPRSFKALEEPLAAVELGYGRTAASNVTAILHKVEQLTGAPQLDTELLREVANDLRATSLTAHEELLGALSYSDDSLLLAISQQLALLGNKELEATRAVTDLMRQQSMFASGKVSYPRGTEIALARIREEFPDANAQVLCDLVEPVSPKWHSAIEGYMGGARFNILVAPTWERLVIDFVRQHNLDARVVQGSLCLERRSRIAALPPQSIVHELRTDNELAEAFLYDQFGMVEKVQTSEELRRTTRGLMMDGKAAGSRTMYLSNARGELVFGKSARLSQAGVLQTKLEEAEAERESLNGLKGVFSAMKLSLGGLKLVEFDAPDFESPLHEIAIAQGGLNALDLSASESLEEESQRLKVEIQRVEVQVGANREAKIRSSMEIESSQRLLKAMDDRSHTAREQARAAAGKLLEIAKLLTSYPATLRVDELAAQAPSVAKEVDALNQKHSDAAKAVFEEMAKARDNLTDFNTYSRPDERFVEGLPFHVNDGSFDLSFADAIALQRQVAERVEALTGLGLLNNTTQLDKAVGSFNDAFTKQFCVEIKSKVEDGIRTLRQINSTLKNLVFGYDRYILDWSRWEPEMQEYLEFFSAVTLLTAANEDVDLFSVTSLDEKSLAVRDKLVGLLLDEDQERAQKQLLRIADYRNYRRYDVIIDSAHGGRVSLSESGSFSGGQAESPSYVVRAAVLANKLKMFEKGPSLKLVLSDESFAKMDEARSRAVLQFFGQQLGLQVICAMPTMKAGSLQDEFDRQYSFSRMNVEANGELDFITDVDERIFNPEEMRKAWDAQRLSAQEIAKIAFEQANPVLPNEQLSS